MSNDKENNAPLNAEPTPYGWDCAGTFVRTRLAMESFKKDGINPTPLYTTPVSAEPVSVPQGWRLVPIEPTEEMLLAGDTHEYDAGIWWSLMLDAAPVSAQPDLTLQTLDDVKAGIPARDAEIKALRKQIEALQSVLTQRLIFPTMLRKMWSGSEVQAWLDDELAKLTKSSSQQNEDHDEVQL